MSIVSTVFMFILIAATAMGSVGDALNVSVVGSNVDGPSGAVALAEGLAFHGRGGVIEVLDATTWVRLGQIELPGVVQDIVHRDGRLYVAAGRGGLRIVAGERSRCIRSRSVTSTGSAPRTRSRCRGIWW